MPNVLLPSNVDLQRIERQLIPTLTFDDPIFKLFPMRDVDAVLVEWEQEDNFTGVQAPRPQNGQPAIITLTGGKRYEMTPGSYGEAVVIYETDLENAREWGTLNTPMPLDDLVFKAQDKALNRRIDRIRLNLWTLLGTGTFQVANILGGLVDAGTYPLQTASAAVAWSSLATATPLADFRALKILERGYSTTFGRNAKAYMNVLTANNLLNNQNQNDLAGKRRDVGASYMTIDEVNKINAAQDLPEIVIYDKGYYQDPAPNAAPGTYGPFTVFIPTGTVIIVGDRPAGQTVGEWQNTRNAVNDNCAPGAYTFVTESKQTGQPVPWWARVDDGFKGGPAVFFPSSIVILST